MFQTFDSKTDPAQARPRIEALRAAMAEVGVDLFLIPRADEHQGEYVPPRAERLQWLTGFTGSAGMAIVAADKAAIFVDGRYTLQVQQQCDGEIFAFESLIDHPPHEWLEENARPGLRIGFDPWLHTVNEAIRFQDIVKRKQVELVAVENLVDRIWEDQPAPPLEKIAIQPESLAGRLAKDKLPELAEAVRKGGAVATVLTDPSSVAWAFNIRGADVAHTPLPLAFAIIPAVGMPLLFIDERKLDIETRAYLTQLCTLHAPDRLLPDLEATAAKGSVGLDFGLAAEKLRLVVEAAGGTVISMADPARLPRAVKNAAELAGSRDAHRRDGAAMVEFMHWLDAQQPGSVTEIDTAKKLEALRAAAGENAQMPLRDISFDTISGAGPNGAVIHYRVTTQTNRRLEAGELYLIDSGGQYQDGTTDITRTVPIGAPTDTMRRHYTIVLKGMVDMSMLRFPAGTRGTDIDAIARIAHWKAGLDYAHGTGHGVGSYLAVHEGPQRLAKTGTEKLVAGMILSNEPGYYRPGEYGIRIENLIVVEEARAIDGGDLPMHGFETLTLCPFDRRLIAVDMLTVEERAWIDAYHSRVRTELTPIVSADARAWLEKMTAEL